MAISHISFAVGNGVNPTTSDTITIPTVAVDDILVLACTNRDATAAPTVVDNDSGGNTWSMLLNQAAATNGGLSLWWKRATSATSFKTVTVSGVTGTISTGLSVYRGASKRSNPFGTAVGEANALANETQAAYTTTEAGSEVILAVACTSNDTLNPATATATDPTTLTERWEEVSSGGSDASCTFFSGAKATAGSTGALNWAQTDGTGASVAVQLLEAHAYVLTAVAGSYPYAGVNATTRADYKVDAGAGSYAYAGVNATLIHIIPSVLNVTSGLQIWWRFLAGTGYATVLDSSSGGKDGTLAATPTWMAGPKTNEGALSLNGTSQYAYRGSVTLPTSGSIAFWFYPDNVYNSGDHDFLCSVGTYTSGIFQVAHYNSNHIMFGFNRTGDQDQVDIIATAANWAQNTWQHYCVTWESGGYTRVYRNGVEIGTNAVTVTTTVASTLSFGTGEGGAGMFAGDIADFRLYDRALSEAEVNQVYGWTPAVNDYLGLQWKFTEGSGSTAQDSSIANRDGTLNNSPPWTTGPYPALGALTFNGSNTNVRQTIYNIQPNSTVMVWAKPARAYNNGTTEFILDQGFDGGGRFHLQRYGAGVQFYFGAYRSGQDDRMVVTATADNWTQNTWQHYAVTMANGGGSKLYRNGIEIGSDAATNSNISLSNWYFGTSNVGANGFSGDMTDLRFYDRVLTPAEIIAAMDEYSAVVTLAVPRNRLANYGVSGPMTRAALVQ